VPLPLLLLVLLLLVVLRSVRRHSRRSMPVGANVYSHLIHGSLCPQVSVSEMASRFVHCSTVLPGSWVFQTDTRTTDRATYVAIGDICASADLVLVVEVVLVVVDEARDAGTSDVAPAAAERHVVGPVAASRARPHPLTHVRVPRVDKLVRDPRQPEPVRVPAYTLRNEILEHLSVAAIPPACHGSVR